MKALLLPLLCIYMLPSFALAQYDKSPLFVLGVNSLGKPTYLKQASARRIVYPIFKGAYPFIDVKLNSDTILVRGFVSDTINYSLSGPYSIYNWSDSISVHGRYLQNKRHSKWYTLKSADTVLIRTFYLDTLRLCICLNQQRMIVHESPLDHSPREAFPINLDEVKRSVDYPAEAKEKNKQGMVILRIYVDSLGVGSQYSVVQTPDPSLSKAVLKHTKALKFEPALYHGSKIGSWINVPFEFRLLNEYFSIPKD
jgi:TonB family protein